MTLQVSSEPPSELRRSRRANVFLAGVIHCGGSSFPVRIRNLSPTGALVDGKDMPAATGVVRLQRGPHSASATVVWSNPAGCGVRFESAVPVHEWIAYGRGHSGQQRVDDMLASVRAGGEADAAVDSSTPLAAIGRLQAAEQLDMLARELQQIAADLSDIPAVAEEDITALQRLDIAAQRLVGLAAMVRPDAR